MLAGTQPLPDTPIGESLGAGVTAYALESQGGWSYDPHYSFSRSGHDRVSLAQPTP